MSSHPRAAMVSMLECSRFRAGSWQRARKAATNAASFVMLGLGFY